MSDAGLARARPVRSSSVIAALTLALGCAALVMRTISYQSIAPTALVGVAGLIPAVALSARTSWRRRIGVTLAGIGAFALARFAGHSVGIRTTHLGMAGLAVAAVAEEAFFRRLAFAHLERFGAGVAIGVTAFAFAFIHLPLYGMRAMPIDIAAGALLGWQRWAAGTWLSPAITHVFANFVMLG